MHEVIATLQKSKIVKEIQIIDLVSEKEVRMLKAKAILIDKSILFINRYVDENTNKYSYHWQTKSGKLKLRWDNAPHHKSVSTFPHHQHTKNKRTVKESSEITIEEVLAHIRKELSL